MTKILRLDDDDDSVIGAVDSRKDFTRDFGLAPGDTSRDEEIAMKLAMAEEESGEHAIDFKMEREWKDAEHFARDNPQVHVRHAEAQARNAETMRHNADTMRRNAETELARERDERQRLEREHSAENERRRNVEEYNKLAAERAMLRATYPSAYPSAYDRIYNWSLGLLPDYYDYVQRRELKDTLSQLIKRDLLLNVTESELERKIRQLITKAKVPTSAKSKPTKKLTKSKPTKKPAKKPAKTAKSKKSAHKKRKNKSRR